MPKKTQQTQSDYRTLTDYIQSLYSGMDVEPPWALFAAQINNIKNTYNLSYIQILHILQYMTQMEDIDIRDKDTLGLIPYFINRTDKYLADYKEKRKAIKDFEYNENVIKINPKTTNSRRRKKNESFE